MKTTTPGQRIWFIAGASRGLGAEIAKAALAAGETVVGTGRRAEEASKSLGAAENALAVELNVNDDASVSAAVETAITRFGGIDVPVNNAGFGLLGAVEEASAEDSVSLAQGGAVRIEDGVQMR